MSISNKKLFLYVLICIYVISLVACPVVEKVRHVGKVEKVEVEVSLLQEYNKGTTQKVPKLYLIGGFADGYGYKNDVWSLTDGITWKQETDAAFFSARKNHQVVLFQGKLYLIGGFSYNKERKQMKYYNDVWSSTDGMTWKQEIAAASFPARRDHRVAMFQDKLYLIGGFSRAGYETDIWSSTNGIIWTEEITDAPFSGRTGHQVVLFQGKLYLIGGASDGGRVKNDVWSLTDGMTWKQETDDASFSPRRDHQVVLFQNKLYLIGGFDTAGYKNDVWSSTNGKDWTQVTSRSSFSPRRHHQVAVFQDKMYLIGLSSNGDGGYKNGVWSSGDGMTWKKVKITGASDDIIKRSGYQVVVFSVEQ